MNHLKKIKKHSKHIFRGISLRWDEYFLHNLVVGLAVVMIWVGIWGVLEIYLVDYGVTGRIVCILIGILLLYLVDGGIGQIGGKGKSDDE